MPLSRRYSPEHPPGENCIFGMDYSTILPPGVGIAVIGLSIWTNTATPGDVTDSEWVVGDLNFQDRTVYATLEGGVEGHDYQIRWLVIDSEDHAWPRTALLLCAQTS